MMKVALALLFLFVVFAQPSFGQSVVSGERADESSARRSVNGFGAHLFLVEKPKEFIETWEKTETPRIETISVVKPRQQFGAFILFTGCLPDNHGQCDCEVDFDVYQPDGHLFIERKGLELWKQTVPPVKSFQLSVANLFLRMGIRNPAGQYIVKAKVHDKHADVEFEVRTSFRLEAGQN
jgi:hypothetical protein